MSPAGYPLPAVTSEAPIRASLDRALTETLAQIPREGRGYLQADVANTGARVELGHRVRPGWTVGGWAGMAWGKGPEVGVRSRWDW